MQFATRSKLVLFSVVSVCMCMFVFCERDNYLTVWHIIVKFEWEQDMVESSDDFENGCI